MTSTAKAGSEGLNSSYNAGQAAGAVRGRGVLGRLQGAARVREADPDPGGTDPDGAGHLRRHRAPGAAGGVLLDLCWETQGVTRRGVGGGVDLHW